MMNNIYRVAMTAVVAMGMLGGAQAAVEVAAVAASHNSPVQAKGDVLGLDIVGKVQAAGSDEAAAVFQKEVLPDIMKLINVELGERVAVNNYSALAVDPTKLTMTTEATARVYFVGEGAGYANSLGFDTLKVGEIVPNGDVPDGAQLIFPNASSSVSTYNPAGKEVRTAANPLLPGDFVDLGVVPAGSLLDFFLVSNGMNGGSSVFSAFAARNPDKLNHVVMFALADSPYLIMAFEDLLGGGDKDFNDVIFAIDIGKVNVQNLVSAPEPGLFGTMAGFLGIALYPARRRRQ